MLLREDREKRNEDTGRGGYGKGRVWEGEGMGRGGYGKGRVWEGEGMGR